jgi:hypothetical protein
MARSGRQTNISTEQAIVNRAKTLISFNLKQGIGASIVGGVVNNGVLTLQDSTGGTINIYGLDNSSTPFATDSEVMAGVLTAKVASVKQIIDNYITRAEVTSLSVHLSSGFITNNDLHLILTDGSEVVVPDISDTGSYDHFIFNSLSQTVTHADALTDWDNI